jgi:predicted HAD superfamily Cof-like phosphohydrolase
MRSTNFELVGDFQREVLGNRSPAQPRFMADPANTVLCLEEEVAEFAEAIDKRDLVAAVDALVDLVYFALGASYQMGVNFDQAFLIVHMANLQKQRGKTKRPESANGDAVKPEGWTDPKAALAGMLYGAPQS